MKKFFYYLIILIIFLFTLFYREDILVYYNQYLSNRNRIPTTLEKNEYFRDYNFKYVQNTENFWKEKLVNKMDLLRDRLIHSLICKSSRDFWFSCK